MESLFGKNRRSSFHDTNLIIWSAEVTFEVDFWCLGPLGVNYILLNKTNKIFKDLNQQKQLQYQKYGFPLCVHSKHADAFRRKLPDCYWLMLHMRPRGKLYGSKPMPNGMREFELLQSVCNVVSPGNLTMKRKYVCPLGVCSLNLLKAVGGQQQQFRGGCHIKQKEDEQGFRLLLNFFRGHSLPAAFLTKGKHRFKSRPQRLENNFEKVRPLWTRSLMVLGRLPLSVHFMATVVSQLMTLIWGLGVK